MNGSSTLKLAFYGDDFTGSTDAAECLAFAGLRTLLFLKPPTMEDLARFPGLEAIGVAGDSRALTPSEMDEKLPSILATLQNLGAPFVHYKTCSTFDSSPATGSIGRIMDIARKHFHGRSVPIVVGAPALGRYCLFGNLFARAGIDGEIYRLDRHPTMSVHPVTAMDEADIRRHLSRQTSQTVGLFDYLQCAGNNEAVDERFDRLLESDVDAVLFDVVDRDQLTTVGRLLTTIARDDSALFVVGSSGVEYALTQWWRQQGELSETVNSPVKPGSVDQILVVSGSASPVTASQIDAAVSQGYACVAVDPVALMNGNGDEAIGHVARQAVNSLRSGKNVLIHTSHGPHDPRIGALNAALRGRGMSAEEVKSYGGRELGKRLGHVLKEVLSEVDLTRVVVAGGDTSSHATQALGLDALEIIAPIAPGGPLCRAVAPGRRVDGLEITLKGGQVGHRDFFEAVRMGRM
jgi:uncharacterized protein YgbK (DUF1537 family)